MTIHAAHFRMKVSGGTAHGMFAPLSRSQLQDLLAPIRDSIYAGESVVLLRWCDRCDQWMREGSAAAGCCVDCGSPRPRAR